MDKRTLLNNIWYYGLCILFLFPLLPRGVETILLITILLLSLALIFLQGGWHSHPGDKRWLIILLLSAVPILYLISLLFTANLKEGFNQLIRVLPLFVLSITFGGLKLFPLTTRRFATIKLIYVISVVVGLLILHIVLFRKLNEAELSPWDIRQLIESYSDVHGTYLSIWIGFALIITCTSYRTLIASKGRWMWYGIPGLLGYFLYWQYIIGARTPLIATLFLLFVYIILELRRKKAILFLMFLLLTPLAYLGIKDSRLYNRIESALSWEHRLPEGDYSYNFKKISSEDIRKGIYYCSWELAVASPISGYGVGDVQDKLDSCYLKNISSNVYQRFHYNTHNQYFQIWLAAGILAIIPFLASLALPVFLAYRNADYLLFACTMLISICFLTENVFGRHDGVLFYSLFNTLLIFQTLGSGRLTTSSIGKE